MTTLRTRLMAAGTTILVAAAAAFGAAGAALATPLAPVTITPSSTTPGIWDDVSFGVQFGDLDSSCYEGSATWASWHYNTGSSWTTGETSSGSVSFDGDNIPFNALGNGYSLRFTVTVSGCNSPISETVTIGNEFTQYYAYGYVYTLQSPYGIDDLVAAPGVTVDLLEVANGPTGEPVATDVSEGSNAAYSLYAPFEGAADLSRTYKIRFTYPDGGPVLYYDASAHPGGPGTTNDWNAATVGGPGTWVNTNYDSYAHAEWSFSGSDVVSGVVYAQTTPYGTDAIDYSVVEDAFVRLVDGDGDSVDTDSTDSDGHYDLTAPVDTQEQVETSYRIEVTYPDESVWYYLSGASYSSPSAAETGDATTVSPSTWGEANHNVFAGVFPGFSRTHGEVRCNSGDADVEDWESETVFWEEICVTDATVGDGTTLPFDHNDAFDTFGDVKFPNVGYEGGDFEDEYYYVTADSDEQYTDTEGAHYNLVDEDAWVYNAEGDLVNVDIVVTRVFSGSWVRWGVKVYYAGTEILADAPFIFEGELGSDSDTQWIREGGLALSHDTGYGDPIVLHVVGDYDEWYTEDGDDNSEVHATGELAYIIGLVDYGCGFSETTIEEAVDILTNVETAYGTALEPVSGAACAEWIIPSQNFTVGVPVDVTFTAPDAEPWNWNWGGRIDVWGLPAGLEYEEVDPSEANVPPSLRIFGTPEEAGEYEVGYDLRDDYSGEYEGSFVIMITAPGEEEPGEEEPGEEEPGEEEPGHEEPTAEPTGEEPPFSPPAAPQDLDLELDLQIGGQVSGSQATGTATGLAEGADFDLIVRSTPQTLAAGTVPSGGTVTQVVTLPTLEAGWHSLTFTSTWAAGGVATAKVWFQVSESGTLLAVSRVDPALAATGQDVGGTVFLAATSLLAGFALVALRRRRGLTRA